MPRLIYIMKESGDPFFRLSALWAVKTVLRKSTISKKDGHRHINTFNQYEDILIYCKTRKLFNISMTTFLVL